PGGFRVLLCLVVTTSNAPLRLPAAFGGKVPEIERGADEVHAPPIAGTGAVVTRGNVSRQLSAGARRRIVRLWGTIGGDRRMAGLARFARTLAGIGLIAVGLLPAPALAIMPEDELEANVWCYQSWFVFGVRYGYSDPVHALR